MSAIEVVTPGLLTTVQDLGREGFGPLGVSPSGAADPIALRLGNRLVGNVNGAAGLEMTLLGGTFVFLERTVIALTGADFAATLDGIAVPLWVSVDVRARQTLRTGATHSGARCYLCVSGGIDVKLFLGSASTHLLSGLGGNEGRALRKGDVLKTGPAPNFSFHERTVAPKALQCLRPRKVLRVTPGPQQQAFTVEAQKIFRTSAYRVAEESNRMGLRLEGPPITGGAARGAVTRKAASNKLDEECGSALGEMTSEGVSLGAVQIAAGGLPIILFVEQQTTGGYPKIANVISADLHGLGQLRPRDKIRFERVNWETARRLLLEQEELLASEKLIV